LRARRKILLARLAAGAWLLAALFGCTLVTSKRVVSYVLYPVKEGDTLSSVGKRFGVSPDKIAKANKLSGGEQLAPGTTLKVPVKTEYVSGGRKSIAPAPRPESVRKIKLSGASRYIGKLLWPVEHGALTSKFGPRWLSFHEGIDLAAGIGAPIRAAHDGQVVYSNDGLRGYGNLVVLRTEDLLTVYAHNRSNVVRLGQHVRKGDVIAYVGETGKASGPHLHFETRIKDSEGKNTAVDPLAFFLSTK
jgi:lipoprotein NlpD